MPLNDVHDPLIKPSPLAISAPTTPCDTPAQESAQGHANSSSAHKLHVSASPSAAQLLFFRQQGNGE